MRGRAIRWALPLVLVVAAGASAMIALAANTTNSSSGTVDVAKTSSFGSVLVAANGRTLYRYTVDSKGVNRCSSVAVCNKYWPALTVKAGTKPSAGSGVSSKLLGTIAAAHGMTQVTYAGYPLYYFSGDKKVGQSNGQGFDKKWYVVSSTGAVVKQASKSGAASTSSSGSSSGGWG